MVQLIDYSTNTVAQALRSFWEPQKLGENSLAQTRIVSKLMRASGSLDTAENRGSALAVLIERFIGDGIRERGPDILDWQLLHDRVLEGKPVKAVSSRFGVSGRSLARYYMRACATLARAFMELEANETDDVRTEETGRDDTRWANVATLDIDAAFVQEWSDYYDKRSSGSYDQVEESAIRAWLSKVGEPKYLNKEYFVRLGRWKTKRQTPRYEENDEDEVEEKTRAAYLASDKLVKLNTLRGAKGGLRGVGVAVAATILHYLQPDEFAIFDYHVRNTLNMAGHWSREIDDDSDEAWLDYLGVMHQLSGDLGVSLRTLDKALFAFDKYGSRGDDKAS